MGWYGIGCCRDKDAGGIPVVDPRYEDLAIK